MAQTTTNQSRANVPTPDLDFDTVIDGGTALKAAVDAAFAKCGNNLVGRWSNNITLANGATTTFEHDFSQTLSNLKVLFFISNALISKATQDADFTLAQIAPNTTMSITNISGGSLTFQVYVLAFPLSVRTTDIDASIDATIARLEFTAGVLLDEMATPSTPSSGKVAVYAKTDKKLYTKDSNGTESQVGSGSSGSINYIANADFENGSITGWATYADAAGTTPVDGTAGSSTTTFASSTSSPPRGTYCGLLTKDAANRQGEGCSYVFTIANADVSRTLQITYDSVASANLASGDVTVFVYDITNSTLITPSANSVPTGTSSQHSIAFNSSTSTSYRLIFHVATTNASAYTLKLDQISISPIIRPVINGNSDMGNAYTPTSSWSANTTHTGKWARQGDMMRGQILLSLAGAPTSATLTSVTLPTGYVIDTTKLVNAVAGVAIPGCYCTIKSAGAVYTSSSVWYVDTTTLKPTYDNGSGIATAITQAAPGTFANGDYIQIDFLVPIVGWSSGITLSSSAAVIEYCYNTSGTTSAGGSDTTSFGYGAIGTAVGAIASTTVTGQSATTMRVRFQNPVQITDRVELELQPNGAGSWIRASNRNPPITQGAGEFGVRLTNVSGSSTDFDVAFGNGGRLASNATYATAGSTWTGDTSLRWRVAKYSAIGAGEVAPANSTTAGTISRENVWTAYTPIFTGLGTVVGVTFFYKILGDSLYIKGVFSAGTVAAALASMTLPSGLTINTGKTTVNATTSNPGEWVGWYTTDSNDVQGGISLNTTTSTTIAYFGGNSQGNTMQKPGNGNALFITGQYINVRIEIPL